MLSAEPDKLQPRFRNPRLERSPHPYNRQSIDLSDGFYKTHSPLLRVVDGQDESPDRTRSNSSDNSSKRGLTTSPSDSGTEADDERPILRALTAPPLRPRKGLRIPDGPQSISPVLTPPGDDQDPFSLADQQKPKSNLDGVVEEEKLAKTQKRRRYVVFRRTCECLLLGLVGRISYNNVHEDFSSQLRLHALIVSAVYAVYGLHLLFRRLSIGWTRSRELGIRIPVTKDPAPIIYPVLIPIFVAFASAPGDGRIILTNFVLSICSIPRKAVVPQSGHLHWLISILPLLLNPAIQEGRLFEERATLLFPLHQALLSCVEYLVTTSLLSTELQLLTVALVNLGLFARSPQALIVKALLWVGGLSLYMSCRHVLSWTVSLARIPNWRYRQVKHGIFKRSPVLRTLDGLLGGWLSSKIESSMKQSEQDSDDEHPPKLRKLSRTRHKDEKPRSSSQHRRQSDYTSMLQSSRQRRNTLPVAPSALTAEPFQLRRTASLGLQKLRERPKTFQALTSAQAVLLKWIYAGYTYLLIVLTIFGPVRMYIGTNALSENEPFGWALGYLFGSIPWLRMKTVYWNLDWWIPLPLYDTSGSSLPEPSTLRLLIAAHVFGVLIVGIAGVLILAPHAEVDTRRKLFHGMMVTMFLPTILIDPCFISLALSLALAVFLLLDLFRASQLPPLSRPLTLFLAPYVDGRDHRGPVIVSHIFLLIGCAIPLWLELAASPRTGQGALSGWSVPSKSIGLVSGVICVGMGDAAASLIGRRFGRRRWPWGGGKSFEGSAAFALAVTVGLGIARAWLWMLDRWDHTPRDLNVVDFLVKAIVAACGASFTEAVLTGANDNVLVPVVLWLLVKGLGL